jgi:hypothetical protein
LKAAAIGLRQSGQGIVNGAHAGILFPRVDPQVCGQHDSSALAGTPFEVNKPLHQLFAIHALARIPRLKI